MSKIESGSTTLEPSPFALSDLLEDTDATFAPQAQKKGQQLEITCHDVVQDCLIGDKLRLSEILHNLLSNAITYTPEGGKVSLTVRGLEQITPGFEHIMFEVKDNGIGMSHDFARRIFEPFTREQNSTASGVQGAGLGMTITKSLVDLMGGTITVDSAQGLGTTVRVELELRPAEGAEDKDFWKRYGIRKALVLGPDEHICRSICSLMDNTGTEVQYATESSRAEELASVGESLGTDSPSSIDLILLDGVLPGMDVLESIEFIRSRFGDAPALLLINNSWLELEEDARHAGADGFLPAPFAMSTLKKVVENCRELSEIDTADDNENDSKQPASEEPALKGLRLLVAEDNEINAEIIMELLGIEGAECEHAADGREAVAMLQERPAGYYDAVMMDIQMPVMDGYEAAAAIRQLPGRPDAETIPIIAMTANAFADDVQKSMEAGMNAHLSKPIVIEEVVAVIRKLVGRL